jgi:hypothetical protein
VFLEWNLDLKSNLTKVKLLCALWDVVNSFSSFGLFLSFLRSKYYVSWKTVTLWGKGYVMPGYFTTHANEQENCIWDL